MTRPKTLLLFINLWGENIKEGKEIDGPVGLVVLGGHYFNIGQGQTIVIICSVSESNLFTIGMCLEMFQCVQQKFRYHSHTTDSTYLGIRLPDAVCKVCEITVYKISKGGSSRFGKIF